MFVVIPLLVFMMEVRVLNNNKNNNKKKLRKNLKLVAVSFILVLSLGCLTACGDKKEAEQEESQGILEQEVNVGTQLEDKAREQVNKQGEEAGQMDGSLESIPTE